MKFDPSFFLEVARDISSDDHYCYEAGHRTCINRAYYAAHLISRGYLESLGYNTSAGTSAHRDVIDKFTGQNQKVRGLLHNLFKLRKDADYKLNVPIEKKDADYSISMAEEILEEIKKMNKA